MAQEMSNSLMATYGFPRLAHLHFLIRLRPLRQRIRGILRALFDRHRPVTAGKPDVTATLEAAGEDYRRQRWAYLENVWELTFHRSLVEQWPAFYYFEPIKAVTKGYDLGFLWGLRDAEDPPSLDHFPALKAAYDHLRSPGFAARVTALAGDGVERACYQILLTRSFTGSSVIAHRDSNIGHDFTNMIFFLDGTGGPGSGGLGIWNDNEFRDPQFVPENLTNTCLVYDMSAPFFHGFKPMRFSTHRWTINAAFRGAESLQNRSGP